MLASVHLERSTVNFWLWMNVTSYLFCKASCLLCRSHHLAFKETCLFCKSNKLAFKASCLPCNLDIFASKSAHLTLNLAQLSQLTIVGSLTHT
ncbi:hypothetical protein HanRHA438_Chr11g0519051 [Helianthus annuus]|nr:hypothetical protein HanRHA438_Chr11g0519051 [Helianthus annuus]